MNPFKTPTVEETAAAALDGHAAARLSGLSAKTLERRALEGAPVGRIKIGRRVLFHRATLEAWLASLADNAVAEQTAEKGKH